MIRDVYPGSRTPRIRGVPNPDPGVKKHWIPDPKHCIFSSMCVERERGTGVRLLGDQDHEPGPRHRPGRDLHQVNPEPGTRYPVPGTRYPVPGTQM
jgi:hypothetical protein